MHIKVLYLAPPRRTADRLTAFTFVDEEIVALARAGVEVIVLTYPLAGDSGETPHPNVHVRAMPAGRSPREYVRTMRFLWRSRHLVPPGLWRHPALLYHIARIERYAADVLRDDDVDIIHSNFGWSDGFGGVLAAQRTGKPLVATMRGMDVLKDRELDYGLRLQPLYDTALRAMLRHADATTHVSDFIRARAIGLGARENAAVTVMKGVDCERFKPRPSSSEPQSRPMILTVAGLIRRKGIDVIVRALGELAQAYDFDFVVAGRGPERDSLESLCNSLGLGSRTRFAGQIGRDEIPQLFASADIFVLGSIWEGSGNVLIEALASGCPVVCTESGGPPEYIVDGVSGFVVPVRDAKAMAARIGSLLQDAGMRGEFGRRAREQAVERFRYSRMVDDIVSVYRSLIAGGSAAWPSAAAVSSVSCVDVKVD